MEVEDSVSQRKRPARKTKSASKQLVQRHESDMEVDSEMEAATKAAGEIKFTLKQLIRKLHVVEPVENVMCLIGKRFVV